jgi:hypothetical protein
VPPLTKLYKWTNSSVGLTGNVTPWWSFVEPFRLPSGRTFEGLKTVIERAARVHEQRQQARRQPGIAAAEDAARTLRLAGNRLNSLQEYARAISALSDRFSNYMDKFLVVQLTDPVWGFAGRTSAQPEFKDVDNVFLIGGADQLYLPNLTGPCVREIVLQP